jgi:uncharacterized protein (UPF0335 family)
MIGQIESLEGQKANLSDDIKDVYAEAKALGYAPKIIRKVIAIRKRNAADLAEEQALLDVYMAAIDQQLPLFESEAA